MCLMLPLWHWHVYTWAHSVLITSSLMRLLPPWSEDCSQTHRLKCQTNTQTNTQPWYGTQQRMMMMDTARLSGSHTNPEWKHVTQGQMGKTHKVLTGIPSEHLWNRDISSEHHEQRHSQHTALLKHTVHFCLSNTHTQGVIRVSILPYKTLNWRLFNLTIIAFIMTPQAQSLVEEMSEFMSHCYTHTRFHNSNIVTKE